MSATQAAQTITSKTIDGLAVLTLNRPDAYNALNLQMAEDLLNALIACDEDRAVRAVLLTGAGRAFCSGGDIRQMRAEADPDGRSGDFLKRLTVRLHAAVATLVRMPKPVVAAVNGPAAGAGLSLALTGDLVVAADTANFTVAYTAIGLAPDGSSTFFLPRLVGPKRAYELMALNRPMPAEEALSLGMINAVFPAANFAADALAYALRLANGPTRALGHAKQLLALGAHSGLETSMEFERRAIAECGRSADFIEGSNAFIEKRAATFKGV